jgi:hypothetical protein
MWLGFMAAAVSADRLSYPTVLRVNAAPLALPATRHH